MFRSMSNHNSDHDDHTHNEPPPPPTPPRLMRLDMFEGGEFVESYDNVKDSRLVGPAVFRFEMLDGRIVLCDMAGRDIVLTPMEDVES